ncbi:hypothetical protein MPNT_10400 [Candidatus Methylacidithermus pantelleriae]|uniref:Uncharacterized protein n=1 Tax=Candidatus Methylacidithermus pantelleriae TaxID=2744239 RepID=A0A8J2BMI9_9BACT|nr:hypothetical protein MPNT_10400 [Candidatus Methylacidithermus pantelleriae]
MQGTETETHTRSGLLIVQERILLRPQDGSPPVFLMQNVRSRHFFWSLWITVSVLRIPLLSFLNELGPPFAERSDPSFKLGPRGAWNALAGRPNRGSKDRLSFFERDTSPHRAEKTPLPRPASAAYMLRGEKPFPVLASNVSLM